MEKVKREKEDMERGGEKLLQLVSFKLGNEEFGVNILRVQEINRLMNVTKVPQSPDFVDGVVNLRGKVIPVISLRKRFGLPVKDDDKDNRIVVVEIENNIVGFTVDSVSEILWIPSGTIEPPPPIVSGGDTEYILGVGKFEDRLLVLLNMDKILSTQEIAVLKKAA